MDKTRQCVRGHYAALVLGLVLATSAIGAEPSALTPQQLADQLKAFQAASGATPTPIVPAPDQIPDAKVLGPAAPAHTSRVPTWSDKRRLEAELRTVNRALKVRRITDANTQHADDAIAARGKMLFTYSDGALYELETATYRQTAIELQPGEILTGRELPTAGDTARWTLAITRAGAAPAETVVLIVKPLEAGLETNMTITTNRRIYNVLLHSSDHTFMPLVGWTYPQDEARAIETAATRVQESESQSEPLSVAPDRLHFDCTVSGAQAVWRPIRVYDDGTRTFLQMNPEMASYEAPAFFVIEQNAPLLVNYRVKHSLYVVDRLFDQGQLRVGPRTAVDIRCVRRLARAE